MIFVTGNDYKLQEVQAILGRPLKRVKLDLPEIQSLDVDEVVRHKAEQAFVHTQAPVVVEDVSLEIQAWGGFPGPLIKWVNETITPAGICRLMKQEKEKRVKCVEAVDYFDGNTHHLFHGGLSGMIVDEPRGDASFGFDPIFQPDGYEQTYGEMNDDLKNKISHRSLAWRELGNCLMKKEG